MIVIIDNYDSFVYNLVQRLGELGAETRVFRNDAVTVEQVEALAPSHIVISPGPCTPLETGISNDLIRTMAGKVPILGVCLGHQSIGYVFGARIVRAPKLMHGKTSLIYHDGKTIFEGLENPLEATRYHSLVVAPDSVPDCLQVSAWTKENDIMGIRHREIQVEGVQFHPESILTPLGYDLLRNFLRMRPSS